MLHTIPNFLESISVKNAHSQLNTNNIGNLFR